MTPIVCRVGPSLLGAVVMLSALGLLVTCYDEPTRWLAETSAPTEQCTLGAVRCTASLERCEQTPEGPTWQEQARCLEQNLVCSEELEQCVPCLPGTRTCEGAQVLECDNLGQKSELLEECDGSEGIGCRSGRCIHLCTQAGDEKSNVGCEYWAVDLDNAVPGAQLNAAAQQFALVVSNPQPDLTAEVIITQDDNLPGEPPNPVEIARAEVAPLSLTVFPLGPREVDGSPPGEYNTGTHTALTRGAFRVLTSVPVVAFQFNPLENVNVFSNDASLLKPVEALGDLSTVPVPAYVVLGWPQTISRTDDPNTNFSAANPQDFRAFLTIAATRDNTQVQVTTTAEVVGGGDIAAMAPGDSLSITLDAYDVLNLESDAFNADFTGSVVEATAPIAVFSGGEASDSPRFDRITERRCCADHLEEQLDPLRSAGSRFVAPVSFNRHLALQTAGAALDLVPESEVFRILAVGNGETRVTTSLPAPLDSFELAGRGSLQEVVSSQDFWIESDGPIMLGNITASQSAAGIPTDLPGGDPSFILIPPIEQFRTSYVFLTPDRYSFDSLRIIAPLQATILLDEQPLEELPGCNLDPDNTLQQKLDSSTFGYHVYRCQLSFPIIDSSLDADSRLLAGRQNDGVHQLRSDFPVGVLVDGFDQNVSYGYAAGTELKEISIR